MKLGRFVILASESGTDPWRVVPPSQVPQWVKDPETLGMLAAGEMAQCGDSEWYRVDGVQESLLVLPPEVNLRHKTSVLDQVKQ